MSGIQVCQISMDINQNTHFKKIKNGGKILKKKPSK